MSDQEVSKKEALRRRIFEAKRDYSNCIRWYMEIARYRSFLTRQEDWESEYWVDLKKDADLAWKEAQAGVLDARTEIRALEFELIMEHHSDEGHLYKPEESD